MARFFPRRGCRGADCAAKDVCRAGRAPGPRDQDGAQRARARRNAGRLAFAHTLVWARREPRPGPEGGRRREGVPDGAHLDHNHRRRGRSHPRGGPQEPWGRRGSRAGGQWPALRRPGGSPGSRGRPGSWGSSSLVRRQDPRQGGPESGGRVHRADAVGEPGRGIVLALCDGAEHRPARHAGEVGQHAAQLDMAAVQDFREALDFPGAVWGKCLSRPLMA